MSVLGGVGGAFLPPVIMQIIADAAGVKAGVGEAKAEMTGLEAAGTKMSGVVQMGLAGIAIGAAAVAAESAKMAMNFDQTMALIHTQAGAVDENLDDLKAKVLAIAPTVGQSPEKLAEALYHVESTGFRGAQAIDILTQSAKLASIGMADLDDVTYAMSGVMSVGMKDVKNASDAIAFMNATVGMGDMRMDKLAAAIGTGVLPSFKSAGLGMADFSAALATIADNSVPADEAATRLRMTVALMAAPSGKAADALESIGIKSTQLADDMRKPNGLLVAVMDLKTHLEQSGKTATEQNAIIEEAFGGGRTSGAILTLLEESDKLKSKYDQLGTSEQRAQKTDDAWAEQQKQNSQKWSELKAQLEVYAIKIGEKLLPKLGELMDFLTRNKQNIEDFGNALGKYYGAIGDGIGWVWDKNLKPTFQEMETWLNHLISLWDTLAGRFTGAKSGTLTPNSVAVPGGKIPKYADGGVVPGPKGAAQLAIVHGGEQILSNEQLASMGRGSSGSSVAGGSGAAAAADGGDTVIHWHLHLDSKEIRDGQLRVARRKGQSANTLLPSTLGALP